MDKHSKVRLIFRQPYIREHLCSNIDRKHLQPFQYCYDWIRDLAPYVRPINLNLNNYMDSQPGCPLNIPGRHKTHTLLNQNSIKVYPAAAGLPWRTSIQQTRQSKHWKAVEDGYRNILRAFAEDPIAQRTPSPDVFTVAHIAQKELSRVENGSSRFVTYMYPLADAHRMKLLAEMQCLALLFDESWEIHEHEHDQNFFKSVMPPENHESLSPKSPLQQIVWKSIEAVYKEDELSGGDGGRALVQFLTDYIIHPTPSSTDFKTFGDFMDYRFNDGGMMVCWYSAKFTIGSSRNIRGPKLERINHLVSEQMLRSNDIASYDIERKNWLSGNAKQFLITNGIVIMRNILSLPTDEAAKAVAYANQMEIERLLDAELTEKLSKEELNEEEWLLVTAMLYCITGNMISAVVMRRYGGEGAKLPHKQKEPGDEETTLDRMSKKRRID